MMRICAQLVLDMIIFPTAPVTQFMATAPSQFRGINSDTSLCVPPSGGRVTCSRIAGTAIIDDDNGPSSVDLSSAADVQRFFTLFGEADIDFQFSPASELASLELYFLNYPSEGIGLPTIELFSFDDALDQSGTSVSYVLNNSDMLSSTDNVRRKVTLEILGNQNLGSYSRLRVNFSYTGMSDIEWLFLSEINLCTGTPTATATDIITTQATVELSSNNPSDSVQLSCSVSTPVSFQWQWIRTRDGNVLSGGRFQTSTADGTRTGILEITELRSTDEGSYTCRVNRQGQTNIQQNFITLVLPGEFTHSGLLSPSVLSTLQTTMYLLAFFYAFVSQSIKMF